MVTTKKKVKKRKEVLGRVSTTKKNEITGNSDFRKNMEKVGDVQNVV